MKLETIVLGVNQTNCYLLWNGNHVLIIDPAARAERIREHLASDSIVDAILLTHGHFDHIGAVDELAHEYSCPVYIHEKDVHFLKDSNRNYSFSKNIVVHTPTKNLTEGKHQIGSFVMEVFETPGHSDGSVVIQIENYLFTGDTLFKSDVGRTDLYSGSDSKLEHSLQFLKQLDSQLLVLPGHGPSSTIEEEINTNPYLK